MNLQTLFNLIENDPTALAYAMDGNMVACAERCQAIVEPEFFSQQVTDQGLYILYPGGPIEVEKVLYKLEQTRDNLLQLPITENGFWLGRILKRAITQLEDKNEGIDFSTEQAQAMLTTLVNSNLITQQESDNLSNTCKKKPEIIHEMCSAAWKEFN